MISAFICVLISNLFVAALKLISGFGFPYLMTETAYAEYHTFTLYLSYITILTLGFSTGMFVKYAGKTYDSMDRGRYKSEVRLLGGILLFFTLIFTILCLIIKDKMLVYITIAILPYCWVTSYQSLYQSWGEFKRYSRTNVLLPTIPIIGSVLLFFATKKLTADYYILLFLGVYIAYTAFILWRARKTTVGVSSAPYWDAENKDTLKIGFLICIGNYINVLFHSVGKQVVKLMFDTTTFAHYSFGLSLQTILMVFITSAASPMLNFLASGEIAKGQYRDVKRLLFMLGACSGMAYYACEIAVSKLLPNYVSSLRVIAIYFIAFPAIAIINCLYVNLYKITKQTRRYIAILISVLLTSVVLNVVLVWIWTDVTAVAVATAIVYYLWLLIDMLYFKSIQPEWKDALFLAAYLLLYILCMVFFSGLIGFAIYFVLFVAICFAVYPDTIRNYMRMILKKIKH